MSEIDKVEFYFATHAYTLDQTTGVIRSNAEAKPDLDKTIQSLNAILLAALPNTASTKILVNALSLSNALVMHLSKTQNGGFFSRISELIWGSTTSLTRATSLQTKFQNKYQEAEARQLKELQKAVDQIKDKPPTEDELEALGALLVCLPAHLQKKTTFQQALVCYTKHSVEYLAKKRLKKPKEHIAALIALDADLNFLHAFHLHNPSDTAINTVVLTVLKNSDASCMRTFFTRTYACVYNNFTKPSTKRLFDITLSFFEVAQKHFTTKLPDANPLDTYWNALFKKIPCEIPLTDLASDFICEIAEMSLKSAKYKPLLDEALYWLMRQKNASDSIYRIIVQNSEHKLLTAIVDALDSTYNVIQASSKMDQIMLRFWQLAKGIDKTSTLTKRQKFLLAYFIELETKSRFKNQYYNKKTNNIPRSIQSEGTTDDLIVLLTEKLDHYTVAQGKHKRVSPAFYIPHNPEQSASLVCRTVNPSKITTSDGKRMRTTKQLGSEAKKEAELQKKLTNIRGIWPQLSMHSYTKTVTEETVDGKKKVDIDRVSVISPMGISVLQFYNTHMPDAFCFILEIMADLASGLGTLHTMGLIHGDIKITNALYARAIDSKGIGGWIDFGHLFSIADHKKDPKGFAGIYGTLIFTAPELIATKEFHGDPTKLEVWAFGSMLYTIFKGKKPSWQSQILENLARQNLPITSKQIADMNRLICKEIEEPYLQLKQKTTRSWQEEIDYLICCSLHLCPEDRWTMKQICQHLEKIMKKTPQDIRLKQKIPEPPK